MDLAYAIPGLVAMLEWLLAATLWCRAKSDLNRFGASLSVAGLVTALAGAVWLVWDGPFSPAVIRSSLATGLATSTLLVYGLLARRRIERLLWKWPYRSNDLSRHYEPFSSFVVSHWSVATAMISGFAALVQLFAVGHLLFVWGPQEGPPTVFLPLGMALGMLSGLLGYGGLVVGGAVIVLYFALTRMPDRLAEDQLEVTEDLSIGRSVPLVLEWRSWQVALVALSLSLSIGLLQSWWGLGQVMAGGIRGALISWLLLAAGVYGLSIGTNGRLARVLLALAGAAGVISVLTMGSYLAGTG